MNGANEEKFVQVYAGNLWQAQLVKGLLDANAVPCVIYDETMGAVTSHYAPNVGDVYVVVDKADKVRALEVIEQNTIPDAPTE